VSGTGATLFLCECGDPRCRERLLLTPAAYAARKRPALAPGHRLVRREQPPRRHLYGV
jgi:hypothetical protein